MTDHGKPVNVHYQSAREIAAGIKAAQAWHQELAAAHLLRTQDPIAATPYPGKPKAEK